MSDNIATAYELITNQTATGASGSVSLGGAGKTVMVKGSTTAGSGAATVDVQVSNNTSWPWITAGTISLTLGTAETSDGFALDAAWAYIRFNVTAISGTGAKVSANVGV